MIWAIITWPRFMQAAFIVAVIWVLCGDMNCTSAQVQKEVAQQQQQNARAKEAAKRSMPPGDDLNTVLKALDDSSDLLEWASKAYDEARKVAAEKSADAARWNLVKWIAIIAVAAVALFALWRFGKNIPIVGKLLPGG